MEPPKGAIIAGSAVGHKMDISWSESKKYDICYHFKQYGGGQVCLGISFYLMQHHVIGLILMV